MTVHGAKGLEAPIVILPDTAVTQDSWNAAAGGAARRRPAGLARRARRSAPPRWPTPRRGGGATVRLESRRLLYVALTRARQWLIVCGAGAPATGSGSGESWHDLVAAAMQGLGAAGEPGPLGDIRVLDASLERRRLRAAPRRRRRAAPLPAWLARRPPRAGAGAGACCRPRCSAATLALVGEASASAPRPTRWRAARRCTCCSSTCTAARPPTAPRLAARLLPGRSRPRASCSPRRRACSAAPGACRDLRCRRPRRGRRRRAGAGPRRPADRRPHRPAGGGDRPRARHRLQEQPRRSRDRPSGVPEGILRQLGAYRAALAAVWPDRPIEVAVLWTRAARLMPVPAASPTPPSPGRCLTCRGAFIG